MFSDKSRYKNITQYEVKDHRHRSVKVVTVPDTPRLSFKGYHLLKQGQRIDHMASLYLNDQTGYWRIAEANDVLLPEALSEQPEIAIPNKK